MPAQVLIVDDDTMLRQLLILQLDKLGLNADAAASGSEAIQLVHDCRYALILMDIQMPEMDGYEATQAIRTYERQQGLDSVPIVAVTAGASKSEVMAQGLSDYVQKPATVEALKWIVKRWICPPACDAPEHVSE
jgi:CheY-like chemotaxis protein